MSAPCHHRAPFAPPAQAPGTRCSRPTPGVDGFGGGDPEGGDSEIKAAAEDLRTYAALPPGLSIRDPDASRAIFAGLSRIDLVTYWPMGFFDWLRGKPQPSLDVTFNPPPGSKPFGVDKPISECTDEDIQASREALNEACTDVIEGWRYDAGLDYKSTLFELAVDGMEAATRAALPPVPKELKLRCAALPITATERAMDAEEPTYQLGISLLAETREELEKVPGARIYSTKTKKKETQGKCYFRAVKDVRCNKGEAAGTFLKKTNDLTRRIVLGEELAADFKRRTQKGDLTSQQWIEQVLRPAVLQT